MRFVLKLKNYIMKTIKNKVLFLLTLSVFSFALLSCNNDDDDSGSSSSGHFLKASVDGANYNSYVEPTAVITNGILNLQSSDSNGNSIQIQIANYTGTGTYASGNNDITKGYINYLNMVSMGNVKSYTSVWGTGSVEIKEITSSSVKGTFTATAYENVSGSTNKVEITSGDFAAKIQ